MYTKIKKVFWLAVFVGSVSCSLYIGWNAYHETRVLLKHEEQVSDAINALLNNEDFGYAITDEEGVVIEWNHALEKLSGWSAADMVGNTLERVMEDGLYETHKDALAKAMKLHRKGVSRLSIVKCNIPNKLGGEPIPVRVAVRVVETRHGDFYAIAHIDKLNVEKGGD